MEYEFRFHGRKRPKIMIYFRSSFLFISIGRLQVFVLSLIVKSLYFMNESGFMQYLISKSQQNLFLLQWVIESQAPASKAHEPPGFIFHSLLQHWVPFLFRDFFPPCLYLELSCIIIFAVVIFKMALLYIWNGKKISWVSSVQLFNGSIAFTWNILIVNLVLVFMQKDFLEGKNLILFICVSICWTNELLTYDPIFLLPFSGISKFCCW